MRSWQAAVGAAFAAAAAVIWQWPEDKPGLETEEEIRQAIEACGRGYKQDQGGCQIRLACTQIDVSETLVSGGDTTGTAQYGLRVLGCATADSQFWGNNGASGGTNLRWIGAPGGAVWRHIGGGAFQMTDLGIQLDPGNEGRFDNERAADVGLELVPCNACSTPIQVPSLERLYIKGSRDVPDHDSIALFLRGRNANDQIDNLSAAQIQTEHVGYGVVLNSAQGIVLTFRDSHITGHRAAVKIIEGGLQFTDTIFNCRAEGCAFFDLEWGAAYLWLDRPYAEVQDGHTVFKLRPGIQGNHKYKSYVGVHQGRFNLQCDSTEGPCEVPFLEGVWEGQVTVRDSDFKASGGNSGSETQRFWTISAQGDGRTVFSENHVWTWAGGFIVKDVAPEHTFVVEGDTSHWKEL